MTTLTGTRAQSRPPGAAPAGRRVRVGRATSLFAHGEPAVWSMGGALGLSLMMIVGFLALVVVQGVTTFWPVPVVLFETADARRSMGEVVRDETYAISAEQLDSLPESVRGEARAAVEARGGGAERTLVRTGNYDVTGTHFEWIDHLAIERESRPEWALVVERTTWGRFYGSPKELRVDGVAVATGPAEAWEAYGRHHGESRARALRRRVLETVDLGTINRRLEGSRLARRGAELEHGKGSAEWRAAEEEYERIEAETDVAFRGIRAEIAALNAENARYELVLETAGGDVKPIVLAEIVRAYPANRLGLLESAGIYLSRWREFLLDEPREANSEGGVFPAIFGTVAMTLLMSIVVVPFGVLAALYLREYARQGLVVSAVRIAVNNLAGVPSIVFGVFGLGFFCYVVGGRIDQLFFEAKLPSPTYGAGGIFWASLTLALLTLPVVVVATEEAIASVPSSMREGSYACGATKWQTIRRIVLPKAAPGIMTGMILAIARGAGEVAPLMLVGAAKLAPELPIDRVFPFVHPERSFMHLGFHIYDLGFQSQNSEAAKPMVFTTTLLLIAIIVALNLTAVWVRGHLRRRVLGALS